ncbi:MAG: tripartite tricarboxylate transporter substrate-binding protein, partial [Clostridia bacterium]
KAKPLAVNADQRTPLLPDVPTLAEAGLPQFNVHTWFGLFAPAATPPEIVARLNTEALAALRDPGLRERFAAIAAEPVGNSPAQLVERIRADGARWAEVIRAAKVPVQ